MEEEYFRRQRWSITDFSATANKLQRIYVHESPALSFRLAFLCLGYMLALVPTSSAQLSASAGVAYHDLEEISRWGINGAVYFPLAGHSIDLVPNFEYYYAGWNVGGDGLASDTSSVYAFSVDVHANLPALADRARAYIGSGITYVGNGTDSAFGLNLTSGLLVRVVGWKVFPFGEVTYRVLPEFASTPTLDTYFFNGGLRIVL